jgi:hypothetical protein
MKGIETMLSLNRPASKNQKAPFQAKDLHWRELDMLMWCMDSDGDSCIAVTPGKPPYRIRQEHVMAKPLEKVKKFIDAGLIAYYRTEIYPKGTCCDVYRITPAGQDFVNDHYGRNDPKHAEREAERAAERVKNERMAWRIITRAELERQFGANLYLPSIFGEINDSNTPFIDAPLPSYAPNNRDGQPVTIREYMVILWSRMLSDKGIDMMSKFLTWGEAIGFEESADMLHENSDFSAYDLFGGAYSESDE